MPEIDENIKMLDVPSCFERQSDEAKVIKFSAQGWSIPSGGHLQGIQQIDTSSGEYFIITGSSHNEAYFIVVGRTPGGYNIIQKKAISHSPYRHAGGIQIMGNYLVVGVEDNAERDVSRVLFFDVSEPGKPIGNPIIEIQRRGEKKRATAGAVAVVKRSTDYLLIVGSWDSDTLDFYRSNGAPLDECEFTLWRTWDKDSASRKGWRDDTWGTYQNLNLISDVDGRLFLLGYYCNGLGEDLIDLYSLHLDKFPSGMLRKVGSKRLKCRGGASFKYGGGACIKDDKLLVSYACERNCHDETVINEFWTKRGIIMKALRVFLSCCAIVLSAMLLCASAQALLYDFEDANQIDEWEDLRGTTEIVDGLLCEMETGGSPLISVIRDWQDDWTDYTITVKAKGSVADADWGIVFRVQDVSNYYKWEFCNALLRFVTEIGGTRTAVFTVAQPEVLEEWQDFKAVVEGDTFELYWNDDLIHTATHSSFTTGRVGVASWINAGSPIGDHGGTAYDDFNVEGPGIMSISVQPKGKLTASWGKIKHATENIR